MKIFQNKKIFNKLIIVLLVIMLFSVCVPKSVNAGAEEIGGKLLNPIMTFFVSLGDGAMTLLQKVVLGMDESIINIDSSSSFWAKLIVGLTTLALTVGVVILILLSPATGVAAAIKIGSTVLISLATTVVTFPASTHIVEGMLPDSFYLPLYTISPQEIFSNKIALLDVDFFNPNESTSSVEKDKEEFVKIISPTSIGEFYNEHNISEGLYKNKDTGYVNGKTVDSIEFQEDGKKYRLDRKTTTTVSGDATVQTNYEYSLYRIETTEEEVNYSVAAKLQDVVSNWYGILRNIALVALLSVLVYIGIRIMISSTSADKSKYKQMLMDWVVAICLLFVMHYIMAFSNLIVNKIIDVVDTTQIDLNSNKDKEVFEPEAFIIEEKSKVQKAYEVLVGDQGEESPYYMYFLDDNDQKAGSESTKLVWPAENFMQQARVKLQILDDDKETYEAIGWKIIFVVLVVYTFIFLFTYLRRVVYMIFLTIIAPLVALTYPIDKINDGKAQAFNMWFKEYIFNLLIQPMHLIIYTVLIGSAMEFASKNILYVIVALGFMMPAEKLLRKFFGFSKAETPGFLGGAAGAALMMNGVNRLFGKPPKGHGKSLPGGSNKGDSDSKSEKPPRMNSNFDAAQEVFGDGSSNSNINTASTSSSNISDSNSSADKKNENNGSDRQHTGNNYKDDIIDLNEDEYIIRNADVPELGDSSIDDNNSYSGDNEPYDNDNFVDLASEDTIRSADIPSLDEDIDDYNNDDNIIDLDDSEYSFDNPDDIGVVNPGYDNVQEDSTIRQVKDDITSEEDSMQTEQALQDNYDSKNEDSPKRKGVLGALGAAAKYKSYGLDDTDEWKKAGKNIAKGAAKGVIRGTGMAVGATAGAIAGIASGDVSKFAQYTATGAIGGYGAAKNLDSNIKAPNIDPDLKEQMMKGYYGSKGEYKKVQQEKYKSKYVKNPKTIAKIEEKYGKYGDAEVKKILEKDIPTMLDNGISDMDEITAILDMVKGDKIKSINEGIAVQKYAKRINKDTSQMTGKDKDKWRDTFAKEFASREMYANRNHEAMGKEIMDKVDAFNSIKYK